MRWLVALALFSLAASSCTSSRSATCETISVACDTSVPRPPCETFTAADSAAYFPDARALVGLALPSEIERLAEEDPFYRSAFESKVLPTDSIWVYEIWVYEGSWEVGGLRMGDDGLVALRGCMSVALYPIINYN
ncbi:MAG: hypothetical protein CMM84_06115 [Rhodothermaceae bacterium]|nr:hypothetical protein [Rhodothermaceae bacterium]